MKVLPFFNACTLITRKIMCSRDAQCNTGEIDLKGSNKY